MILFADDGLREVTLAFGTSAGGTQCPAERMLVESGRCNEVPCSTYWWVPSPWNHCEVFSGTCGAGVQHRDVLCYKEDGQRTNIKRYNTGC